MIVWLFAYAKNMQISFTVTAQLVSLYGHYSPTYILHEIATLLRSPVTVHVGLCKTWSETQKTGFLASRLIVNIYVYIYKAMLMILFPDYSKCKDTRPNCKEFDDGRLCTDPNLYGWASKNCYLYCGFYPCQGRKC